MKSSKKENEVKIISEGRTCIDLNSKQKLYYDANVGHWWVQIQTDNGGVSTVILKEDILDELYNRAWGDDL